MITAGRYDKEDYDRLAQIEEQFRVIRDEEARRAHIGLGDHIRTAVRKIGFQPNPQ